MAALQGCHGRGYVDSIYVPTCDELLRRVVRYSGVSDTTVQSIFDDLSYGNGGISHPQPALQPLTKLKFRNLCNCAPSMDLFCSRGEFHQALK